MNVMERNRDFTWVVARGAHRSFESLVAVLRATGEGAEPGLEKITMKNEVVLSRPRFATASHVIWRLAVIGSLFVDLPRVQAQGLAVLPSLSQSPSLNQSQFPPIQRRILAVTGDRLQKPGQEAVTYIGVLEEFTNGQKTATTQVTIVNQYPGLVRIVSFR